MRLRKLVAAASSPNAENNMFSVVYRRASDDRAIGASTLDVFRRSSSSCQLSGGSLSARSSPAPPLGPLAAQPYLILTLTTHHQFDSSTVISFLFHHHEMPWPAAVISNPFKIWQSLTSTLVPSGLVEVTCYSRPCLDSGMDGANLADCMSRMEIALCR